MAHGVSRIPSSSTIFPTQRCLPHCTVTVVTIVTFEYKSLSHIRNDHLFFHLPSLCKTCTFEHRLHDSNTSVLEGLGTRSVALVSSCQWRARDSPYTLTVFPSSLLRKVSQHSFAAFREERACLRLWLSRAK